MNNRYKGDMLGKLDADGIAEWYPKCKVRKQGNFYIATPHTTNNSRKTIRKEQEIAISVKDGKYSLEETQEKTENNTKNEKNSEKYVDKKKAEKEQPDIRITTLKQVFDELYDKHSHLQPHIQKQTILKDMLSLFQNKTDAEYFVNEQWDRKRRNLYTRKQRFEYKAYNQTYEYFFTITYDSIKHTEQSFEKSLKFALSNFHKRHDCLFQGVWERGSENDRLHFHGLIYDPNKKITSGLESISDYIPHTGKMKTYLQSKYFADKFGRNEFSEIVPQMYDSAIKYITKYLSKQGVKPYYSQGLYRFIQSDISGSDVLCRMDSSDERDIRIIVADKFTIWQDGEYIGEVSPETMQIAPKVP